MRMLDLFSGIGGFHLAAEWVWGDELEVVGHVEIDPFCQKVLKKHWPGVHIYNDIRNFKYDGKPIELICGGDPCPIRSKARSIWKTKTPDLSGYFLAVVGRLRPRWVVRENVPASDDVHFVAALEMLGYRTVIISTNAAKITAQNRERDIIVGRDQAGLNKFIKILPINKSNQRYFETKHQKTPAYPVLTTHPCRWDAGDGYIWDGFGLRVANSKERQKLTGFPIGWLDGISKTQMARMTGNAIVPQVVVPIFQAIKEIENNRK